MALNNMQHQHHGFAALLYLYLLLVGYLVLHQWFLDAVGWWVVFGSWDGLFVKVQFGHQWVAVYRQMFVNLLFVEDVLSMYEECEHLLGVGEPGRLLCPNSAACGLKELVLTVGMALRTSRPQVAMLIFI